MPHCCCPKQLCGQSDEDGAHDLPVIKGTVVVHRTKGRSKPGKYVVLQLSSIAQLHQSTGSGKLSREARLKDRKKTKHGKTKTLTYRVSFRVEPSFGVPGAVLVENGHRHEFFLSSLTLEMGDSRRIHFDCNSWVYPLSQTKAHRVFFSNTSYLPSQTPEALRKLRVEELESLRGDGEGERKKWERIYDYDLYNDLGDPDKGPSHARIVLGGSPAYPYPRRGRTGRPPTDTDVHTESRPGILDLDIYVPPDERFSPKKLFEFIKVSAHAIVHFLVPELKSLLEKDHANFQSFQQMMEDLYSEGRHRSMETWVVDHLSNCLPHAVLHEAARESKKSTIMFPGCQTNICGIAEDKMAWRSDEEFAREMLSGLNPAVIRRLDVFPPKSTTGVISSVRAFHIEKNLDSLTLEEAMEEGRIFILDHHDYLLPFLRRINADGVCVYASRTLLFLRNDQTLKPIAIELSLPSDELEEINRVFIPAKDGIQGALWQLAKAHVAVNDSGHHQLISHWLRTHAVVEPFIIATRRQLSAMHPVHRLLEPHFKDTMQINALARLVLLNAGGVLEKTMFPRKCALELSSIIYKDWRFHEQALPADLLKRGMAYEDPDKPSGVQLLFDDYPYAADGLEIWCTIKRWISGFCSVFYLCDEDVTTDVEIQAWWGEIRTVAHGDKTEEDWYTLTTLSSLVEALTTLIWIASALHAAVNFGQYGYAGFPANRPIHCRRFIPEEGTGEFAEFMRDPDKYFMAMLPDRFTTTLGLALIEVLSMHTSDELYLGQRASLDWTDNEKVVRLFGQFKAELVEAERKIKGRNSMGNLKNRHGPAKIPYTLLYPDTSNEGGEGPGITGRGIPNSVSA
ncbi:hypothetical protein Taro_017933 [Colocasia esculenta]|uniref:Lipoxygenase n=1 Tax=Colocasia esculenta TaxID=4460 RepID=A0A843USL2_COLES|nr:hypothetical protein [Colocasia esculenta]